MPLSAASAFCNSHFVNGNETEAPAALGKAFAARDWAAVAVLLTEDVALTKADYDSKLASGKAEVIKAFKAIDEEGRHDPENGYQFGTMKLSANHWVTTRMFPTFVEQKLPPGQLPFIPPHPPYFSFYSAAFLPDCEGKVRRIVLVERSMVGD